MAHIVRRYESLSEFADKVEPRSTTSENPERDASRAPESAWNGGVTFDQAIKYARHGWSEEHEALEGMLAGLTTTVETMMATQWEPLLGIEGGAVDIDRFLSGEPENMIQFVSAETTASNQVVKVLVSTGALADVEPNTIRLRGLAVCCLIELISRTGKAVELWCESTTEATGRSTQIHTQLVKVKDASSYLDLDQIMFALVHPSWHRRLMFAGREHESVQVRKNGGFGGGYGTTYGRPRQPMMGQEVDASVILQTVESRDRDFRNLENAVQWIGKELKRLGLAKEEG